MYLDEDVSLLSLYAHDNDYKPTLKRTINSLYRMKYITLRTLLAANWHDLSQIRHFGIKSQLFLFELLERVSDDPGRAELKIEEIIPDQLDVLVKRYSDKSQSSFDEVLRRVRLNEIKRKLRSMGMTT